MNAVKQIKICKECEAEVDDKQAKASFEKVGHVQCKACEEFTDKGAVAVTCGSLEAYSEEQVQTIANTVAKGANRYELAMFLHIANKYGLDPFLKEIFWSDKMKTIMTSRDGYLKIALHDPMFDGIRSMAVYENDEFSIDMRENEVNHKFTADRGKLVGAYAIVFHKERRPVIVYTPLDEYYKTESSVWRQYTSSMICKCAEAMALKRQFGISGLVTVEEVNK